MAPLGDGVRQLQAAPGQQRERVVVQAGGAQHLGQLGERLRAVVVHPQQRGVLVAEQELQVHEGRGLEARGLAEHRAEGVELLRGHRGQQVPGLRQHVLDVGAPAQRGQRVRQVVRAQRPLGERPLVPQQAEQQLHHLGGDDERQLGRGLAERVLQAVQFVQPGVARVRGAPNRLPGPTERQVGLLHRVVPHTDPS